MSAPTPSDAAIATLLRGEDLTLSSGKVVVEKLGAPSKRLLRLIWSNRVELMKRKGAEQVTHLRTLYGSAGAGHDEPPAGGAPPTSAPGRRWRLHHLRCQSIRGVAPFGEVFEFSVGSDSTLVYGPNGTGKSSLVNAIGWVFTGRVATDCETDSEHVSLYSPPKSGGRPTKLCDWPVVGTLPHGADPKRVQPDCKAELTLKSADGSRTLSLRRTGSLLEENDGTGWRPCPDLSVHGITPLDIQLSISAATVFGRRSLESSPDTRHLLSMMLGYDAIEELGGLVAGLAPALTKAANAEEEAINERKRNLQEKLRTLPNGLRDDHPLLGELTTLGCATLPTPERITEVGGIAAEAVAKAEAELAGALGLDAADKVPVGLADAAAAALASLSRPWTELFPALTSIAAFGSGSSAEDERSSPTGIAEKLEAFEQAAGTKIAARLSWWRQEIAPGSRAAAHPGCRLLRAGRPHLPRVRTVGPGVRSRSPPRRPQGLGGGTALRAPSFLPRSSR